MSRVSIEKVSNGVKIKGIKPCNKCGSNRWKTLVKGKKYECRGCGNIRVIKPKKEKKNEVIH